MEVFARLGLDGRLPIRRPLAIILPMDASAVRKSRKLHAECASRAPTWAALSPLLLVIVLATYQGMAGESDDGFSASAATSASTIWLTDAPFQSSVPDEAEELAEHAAAPQPRQTAEVLMPDRVAVRRMRIGGLYGP